MRGVAPGARLCPAWRLCYPAPHRSLTMAKSEFLAEAKARGFIFQCTDEAALDEACASGSIAGYAGFDLTADSLHVGHMIPIMLLRLFQRHGHRPVALMGGGTTRIGDPSFREEARQLLSDEQIGKNLIG